MSLQQNVHYSSFVFYVNIRVQRVSERMVGLHTFPLHQIWPSLDKVWTLLPKVVFMKLAVYAVC